ncbi:MAG: hypothetical protein HZA54_12570 [Planctomycetes bacterium]|nr:hypothetical protein [Planctomycetota bacterium]
MKRFGLLALFAFVGACAGVIAAARAADPPAQGDERPAGGWHEEEGSGDAAPAASGRSAPLKIDKRPATPDSPPADKRLGVTGYLTRVQRIGDDGRPERLWSGRSPSELQPMGDLPLIDHVVSFPPAAELHVALVLAVPEVFEFYLAPNSPEIRLDLRAAELLDCARRPVPAIASPVRRRLGPLGAISHYVEGADVPGVTMDLHEKNVQGEPLLFRRPWYYEHDPAPVLEGLKAGKLRMDELDDSDLAERDRAFILRMPCRLPRATAPEYLEFHLMIGLRWLPLPRK